jgi:hypothetical protein
MHDRGKVASDGCAAIFRAAEESRKRMIRQSASGLAKRSCALNNLERDPTQNRIPLLLIALCRFRLCEAENERKDCQMKRARSGHDACTSNQGHDP